MEKQLDLRVQKTYKALNTAFTELIEENRFEDFTVNELCERAMVRRTTFYKHFSDKIDYFDFYLKETAKLLEEQLDDDRIYEDIDLYFISMCKKAIIFISEHKDFVNGIIRSSLFPLLLEISIDIIRTDLLTVYKRQNPSVDCLKEFEFKSAFYAGGLLSLIYEYFKKGKELDEDEFIERLSKYMVKE